MRTLVPALVMLAALLVGCTSEKYGIYAKNLTPTILKDVRFIFPEHTFTVDELSDDQTYPFHFLSYPVAGSIPTEGTIEFRTPDNSVHSIKIQIPRLTTRTEDGDFYCLIKIVSIQEASVEEWKQEHLLNPRAAQELVEIANEKK